MSSVVFAVVVLSIVAVQTSLAGNNTITDEVFFDVKVNKADSSETWTGRFVVGVFGDVLPITAFNFVALAKGFRHKAANGRIEKWHYKNSQVHRVVPDFLIQTGDILYKDGRGGRGIYAPYFIDEAFPHSHRSMGMVAMANTGVDSNGSQFYVTLTKARWLDSKNVVFGKVVRGMDTINRLSNLETDENGTPKDKVYIAGSGVLPLKDVYTLSEDDMNKDTDCRPGPTSPDEVEL